LLCVEFIRN